MIVGKGNNGNGSRYNMTWTQGRLASSTENGTTSSYSYDKSGIRTTKTVGTTTYNYITQNGQVVRQTWSGRTLDIIYDNNNAPYACVYTAPGASPVTYYYLTNQQGDVVRLVTATGATVAEYTYDAWGNPLTSSGDIPIGKTRCRCK